MSVYVFVLIENGKFLNLNQPSNNKSRNLLINFISNFEPATPKLKVKKKIFQIG